MEIPRVHLMIIQNAPKYIEEEVTVSTADAKKHINECICNQTLRQR
jgi:hypothetical protein